MTTWWRRQRYLIDFTLASLWRHKGKNLGLLLVYSLMVFLLASVMLFTQSLRREAEVLLQGAPEISLQRLVAGRHELMPAAYLEAVAGIRGVTAPMGRLWGYYYDPAVRANYTLMVPPEASLPRGQISIGAGIARARSLNPGDYLSLRSSQGQAMTWQVRDLLPSEAELVSLDLMLLAEEDFREFFGIAPGFYTDLVLRVRHPREVRTVAEKIGKRLPDTRPILREEILRTYDALFSWREGVLFLLLMGALLAFAILAWDRASGLSAAEKREIGILKAIGWETSDVIQMKFWEGAVISLTAFLLGYLFAYGHVFYGGALIFAPVLKGWAVLYPDFRPQPLVEALPLATLFFFTVFPYAAANIIPIWRVATMDPDRVMR